MREINVVEGKVVADENMKVAIVASRLMRSSSISFLEERLMVWSVTE